jgi:hypothetical protein
LFRQEKRCLKPIEDPATSQPPPDTRVAHSLREVLLHELRYAAISPYPGEGAFMKMELIARKLIQMALDGNLAAIREIHDRCDGKVASAPRLMLRWVDEEDAHAVDA